LNLNQTAVLSLGVDVGNLRSDVLTVHGDINIGQDGNANQTLLQVATFGGTPVNGELFSIIKCSGLIHGRFATLSANYQGGSFIHREFLEDGIDGFELEATTS
jgi:hypothetical protein